MSSGWAWSGQCGVGKVQKEWLFILDHSFDHADGLIGDRIGKVEIIGDSFDPIVILQHAMRGKEMRCTIHDAVETVKTALVRGRMFHIANYPRCGPQSHRPHAIFRTLALHNHWP